MSKTKIEVRKKDGSKQTLGKEGGPKQMDGKLRFDLLPMGPLRQITRVITMGAKKYGDNTYKKGVYWSKYIGAALRHIFAFWGGETYDRESGLHHLAHAITNLMFLLHFEEIHPELDDRDEKYDYPFKEFEGISGTKNYDENTSLFRSS